MGRDPVARFSPAMTSTTSPAPPPTGDRQHGVPVVGVSHEAGARFRYVPDDAVHAACLGPRGEPWVPLNIWLLPSENG
jgi:hypothetical protein